MSKLIDLTGQVFGRLTVIEQAGFTKHRLSKWLCRCVCGSDRVVIGGNLKAGTTTSCGCYAKEVTAIASTTHGMTGTPEFYSWQDILKRCSGSNDKHKRDYLDRGITVHQDFKDSFEKFHQEIGPRPKTNGIWSVGRIDNSLGYTYGNIQWELPTQQARNKTRYANNSTGFSGVTLSNKGTFTAKCVNTNGGVISKSFSVRKYGYDEALALAVSARKMMIEELNSRGAGYSSTHGKDK